MIAQLATQEQLIAQLATQEQLIAQLQRVEAAIVLKRYTKGMYEEPPELPCAHKLAFDTKKQADAAATVAAHQHGTQLQSYQCQYCGLWHLSTHFS